MAKTKSGSRKFAAVYGAELQEFFAEAQMKYASDELRPYGDHPDEYIVEYVREPWTYIDRWCGGEPYMGMTTIYGEGVPCFGMVYFGRVMVSYAKSQEAVLKCLMEALQKVNPNCPWCGPRKFTASNGLCYRNEWKGSVRKFEGTEIIMGSSKEPLYSATYRGGIINKD